MELDPEVLAARFRSVAQRMGAIVAHAVRLAHRVPEILEDAENGLSGTSRDLFRRLFNHFRELNQQAKEMEEQIKSWHRENAESQRLEDIPGIGPLTATALVAAIGNASAFDNARQLAAWLGLVPGQRSSGGKEKLLGITKRGDVYFRTLLIHGARSVLLRLKNRTDQTEGWLAVGKAAPL